MPYLLFLKSSKIWSCHLLHIIGGALRYNDDDRLYDEPVSWKISEIKEALVKQLLAATITLVRSSLNEPIFDRLVKE